MKRFNNIMGMISLEFLIIIYIYVYYTKQNIMEMNI